MRRLLFFFFLSLFVFNSNSNENKPSDIQTEQRIRQLSEKLRCLVCQNQSLADSGAELAGDLRRQLHEQVAAGRSDGEIIEFMVQRYGDFVLYEPPFKPTTLLLWIGPFVLLAAAALGLVVTLRRRRREPEEPVLGAEDRHLVERVLGPAAAPRERDGSAR
jgi:cytochrome c-type biogenesis protein CcmH